MAIRIRIPAIILRAYEACSVTASEAALAAGEVIRQRGSLVMLSAITSSLGAVVVGAFATGNSGALVAGAALILGLPLAFEAGRSALARRDTAPYVEVMAARVGALAKARADLDRREAEVAKREAEVNDRAAMLLAAEAALSAREHGRRKTPPPAPRHSLPLAPVRADDVLGVDRRHRDTAE